MPLTVTFDSNVWEEIALTEKLDKNTSCQAELKTIRQAIENGIVIPFISDVVLILEAVRKVDRAAYFQSFKTTTTRVDHGLQQDVDGNPVRMIEISINAGMTHPGLNIHLSKAFDAAKNLGFKLIKVNRVGFPMADKTLYKMYSDQSHHSKSDIQSAFELANVGSAQAKGIGQALINSRPDLAGMPPLIAFAFDVNEPVEKLVAEWADGDAVIAHYYHGHDYFCTLDRGRGAGTASVLHQSRRSWLLNDFGIKVVSPSALADLIKALTTS
jgi:hypothetical protein